MTQNTTPPTPASRRRQDAGFALRISQDLLDELRAVALRNDRTAAGEARRAIAAHLARHREAEQE